LRKSPWLNSQEVSHAPRRLNFCQFSGFAIIPVAAQAEHNSTLDASLARK